MQKWIMRVAVPMTLATMMAGCGSQEGGQQQGIPWWLWLLLLIIVIVIAWFLWRGRGDDMNATPAPGVKREPESLDIKAEDKTPAEVVEPIVAETTQEIAPVEEEDDVADQPVVDVATTSGQSDDLRVIEGIGPKIASVLNDAGIFTFAALAASDPETLRQILD
ncbi:MAG: hypothetical protein J5I90_15310, partial [Caldilineales bacterium]|nr:hypothetical protein [Caldilineales bacterium]